LQLDGELGRVGDRPGEGQPDIALPLAVLDPQPYPEPVHPERAGNGPFPVLRADDLAGQATQHLGTALIEMPEPATLEPAERVWLRRSEISGGEPAVALGVGECRELGLQPEQASPVPEIE
jgi:hypothetical protein